MDGRPVWVVSGAPRPGAKPKSRDAKMLLKIRGRMWIDKATHQWAKVEAETTDTISWGLFLARLNPGAKLTFEQTEVNSEIWLPKRLYLTGAGRVGLLKRLVRGHRNPMEQLPQVLGGFQGGDRAAGQPEKLRCV